MPASHALRPPFAPTPQLRTVQISGGTVCSIASAQIPPDQWAELPAARPQVLLGFASDYKRLLESVARGMYIPESVTHSLVVLLQYGDAPLPDQARSELWEGFLVPVYQVFLSPTGSLLCWECELQDGWHIEPGLTFFWDGSELVLKNRKAEALRTGIGGTVDSEICECGRRGNRLSVVRSAKPGLRRRPVASAA